MRNQPVTQSEPRLTTPEMILAELQATNRMLAELLARTPTLAPTAKPAPAYRTVEGG